MRYFISLLVACLLLTTTAQARPQPKTFAELWNYGAYYSTNLERKNFTSFLGRYEGKLGLNLFNLPWQVYGVYYGVTSQDTAYWNNALFGGFGTRYMPLQSYQAHGWYDEWLKSLKIYVELLSSTYFKEAASAEAANLATTDTRYGLEVWHEWNLENADLNQFWGELWTKLGYRTTNFGWEDFNNFVFYFQPKLGRHLAPGIEAYLRADLTYSGKSGSSYSYLNLADYGLGLRFQPWRQQGSSAGFFHKFKMFVEVLGLTYLKDKPTDPNKQVTSDVRFGVDFSYGR